MTNDFVTFFSPSQKRPQSYAQQHRTETTFVYLNGDFGKQQDSADQLRGALQRYGGITLQLNVANAYRPRASVSVCRNGAYKAPDKLLVLRVDRRPEWKTLVGEIDMEVGDHLLVPVDKESQQVLGELCRTLKYLPSDYEMSILDIIRRPSLEWRVSQLERVAQMPLNRESKPVSSAAGTSFLHGIERHWKSISAVVVLALIVWAAWLNWPDTWPRLGPHPSTEATNNSHEPGQGSPTTSGSPSSTGSGGGTQVTVKPASIDFGSTPVFSPSRARPVTIKNESEASIELHYQQPRSDFQVKADGNESCRESLDANKSCTYLVTFTPQQAGPIRDSLKVSDSPSVPAVDLRGFGTSSTETVKRANLEFNPRKLDFDSTLIQGIGKASDVKLTNKGQTAVTIDNILDSDGSSELAIVPPKNGKSCKGVLWPKATCTFTVSVTPSQPGSFNHSVDVTYNESDTPVKYQVTGTVVQKGPTAPKSGEPAVKISPPSLDFPETTVGTTSSPKSFSVTNTQNAPLTIQAEVVPTGDYTVDFTKCKNSPVLAHDHCEVKVTFKPTKEGLIPATITVTTGVQSSPQQVALKGVGKKE